MGACRTLKGNSWAHNFVNETASWSPTKKIIHWNRPKPVVTQGDAKLHLKINLCHMMRLSELMNENLSTLNDIFSDSSPSDATIIRKARSTVNLLNRCFGQIDIYIQDRMKKLSCLDFSRRYLSFLAFLIATVITFHGALIV
jgi:hypothetical protein